MIRNTQKSSKRKIAVKACIDLGSSFFRLLVVREGESEDTAPSVVEEREYVGWGEDLVRLGNITPASTETARKVLRRLVAASKGLGCSEPVITGTNTLRSAGNAAGIKSMLEEEVSLPVTVLSEEGEAALGFLGASAALQPEASAALQPEASAALQPEALVSLLHGTSLSPPPDMLAALIDVGGTSTEIAWGRSGSLDGWLSIPWGTHRVLELDRRGGPAPRSMMIKLKQSLLAGSDSKFSGIGSKAVASLLPEKLRDYTILATGGTAVSCAVVQRYMRRNTPVLSELEEVTLSGLSLIRGRVEGLIAAGRDGVLPLGRERVRLLLPGIVLLGECAARLGVPRFLVTTRDLRWGAIAAGEKIKNKYLLDPGGSMQ